MTKIGNVDVEAIRSAVENIERRDGLCHPSALVAAARPKRSPLHTLFTWDDGEAAAKWRTHEARNIIRQIRVETDDDDDATPAFVHVREITVEGVRSGYMSTVRAMASDHREQVIADVQKQLAGLRSRYKHLSEFDAVWEAIDQAVEVAA